MLRPKRRKNLSGRPEAGKNPASGLLLIKKDIPRRRCPSLKIGNTAQDAVFQFTFSLNAFAALKTGVLLAAISIASPVAGFRP